jgi:16S rRNA processing protein RimM
LSSYIKIGKLVSAHGVQGELILQHHFGKKTSLKGLQAIFLEDRKDSFLPWFVEAAKARQADEVLIKLDGINNRESALKLVQKEVWLPEETASAFTAKSAPLSLLGYIVVNNKTELGPVLELIEQPQQLLCRLEMQGKEVLIPLHEESLQKIDHKKRVINVALPDGLLDIYLGL